MKMSQVTLVVVGGPDSPGQLRPSNCNLPLYDKQFDFHSVFSKAKTAEQTTRQRIKLLCIADNDSY